MRTFRLTPASILGIERVDITALAVDAIRRRDFASHGAWMIRAYALGMGAGTQVVVLAPWSLITGEETGPTRDL